MKNRWKFIFVFFSFAGFFILVTLAVIVIIIANRTHRTIRTNSFMFIQLILSGILLGYVCVFIFGVEPTPTICKL